MRCTENDILLIINKRVSQYVEKNQVNDFHIVVKCVNDAKVKNSDI